MENEPQQELKEQVQTHIIEEKEIVQETPEQINWKKFREERELDRKQRIEAQKIAQQKAAEAEALKKAMDAILVNNTKQQKKDDEDLDEDAKLQKRINEIIEEREREREQIKKKKEIEELPQMLAKNMPDFNKVCTEENLDYLEYHYPEVAKAFKFMPESYDKWESIYHSIKRFIPNASNNKDKEKADKNLNKPQSASIPGMVSVNSAPSEKLSEQRKQENWSRMQRIMKSL